MWSTRSVNSITVNGHGQLPHSAASQGRIVAFKTTPLIDGVVGEAGETYRSSADEPSLLDRFTRTLLFVKPDLLIVYDCLDANEESRFDYWLHATHKFDVKNQHDVRLNVNDVHCAVSFLAPRGLEFNQTNEYDPNPRPRIRLREWHLTATTPMESKSVQFVTLYRPSRKSTVLAGGDELRRVRGGFVLSAELSDGRVLALLPHSQDARLSAEGLTAEGLPVVRTFRSDDTVTATLDF
jgi:hypothetical protein